MADQNEDDKKEEEEYDWVIDNACQAGVVKVPRKKEEKDKINYEWG